MVLRGDFAPSGDIWQFLETFLTIMTLRWVSYWQLVSRHQGLPQHPTIHRIAPVPTMNYLAPDVHDTEMEKTWPSMS